MLIPIKSMVGFCDAKVFTCRFIIIILVLVSKSFASVVDLIVSQISLV